MSFYTKVTEESGTFEFSWTDDDGSVYTKTVSEPDGRIKNRGGNTMGRKIIAVMAATGISLAAAGTALTDEMDWGAYKVGDKRSGYTYAKAETRAIQDDEFDNPAFLWVD